MANDKKKNGRGDHRSGGRLRPVVHRHLHEGRAGRLFHRQGLCSCCAPMATPSGKTSRSILDARFKATGHENVAMPVLIPESLLQKEKRPWWRALPPRSPGSPTGGSRAAGGAPLRCAPPARRCSATITPMCVHSYRDLPMLIQPVVQRRALGEDHPPVPAHAVSSCGRRVTPSTRPPRRPWRRPSSMLNVLRRFLRARTCAIPVVKGRKTDKEKFAGARGDLYHRGDDAGRQGAAERHEPLLRRRTSAAPFDMQLHGHATTRCSIRSRPPGACPPA